MGQSSSEGLGSRAGVGDPVPAGLEAGPGAELGSQLGRYTVLELLGEGGMGVVYAAYDTQLDRKVALKLIREQSRDNDTQHHSSLHGKSQMMQEAHALAKLAHPNVVAIYDVGTLGEHIYLAMEFVEGLTLSQWLKLRARSRDEIENVMQQAGQGLAAAHAAGLVHRDFKPDNVLVGDDGRARILDFGLAGDSEPEGPQSSEADSALTWTREDTLDGPSRITRAPNSGVTRTRGRTHRAIVGTPSYMALEQHLGLATSPASDQFSFCVAYFEALYGRRPFRGRKRLDFARAQQTGDIVAGKARVRVPRWLDRAIRRGLSANPDDRWPSMLALLAALAHRPKRVRQQWLLAATVLGTWAALIAQPGVLDTADPCQAGETRAEQVWGPTQAQRIESAFAATGLAFARQTRERALLSLDGRMSQWRNLYERTCRQPELKDFDLRMSCLDARIRGTSAVVDMLSEADAAVVEHTAEILQGLQAVEDCVDPELGRRHPLPRDPAARAAIARGFDDLARVRALLISARHDAAQSLVESMRPSVEASDYPPLQIDYELQMASVLEANGGHDSALSHLERAVALAHAQVDDGLAARVAVERFSGPGRLALYHGRLDEVEAYARARLRRAPPDKLLAARLEHAVAAGLSARGRQVEAEQRMAQALPILESAMGKDSLELAKIMSAHARVLLSLGRLDEAEMRHRAALATMKKVLGDNHPATVQSMQDVAWGLSDQGRFRAALEMLDELIEIRERDQPDQPHVIGGPYFTRAFTYWDMGEVRRALQDWHRVRELAVAAVGEAHPAVVHHDALRARLHGLLGEMPEARVLLESVRARVDLVAAGQTSMDAYAVLHMARAHQYLGEDLLARRALERGRATLVRRGSWQGEPEIRLRYLSSMADLEFRAGRVSAGLELAGESLNTAIARFGRENPAIAVYHLRLALGLLQGFDARGAQLHLERARSLWLARFSPDHQGLSPIDAARARVAVVTGRHELAEELFELAEANYSPADSDPLEGYRLCVDRADNARELGRASASPSVTQARCLRAHPVEADRL